MGPLRMEEATAAHADGVISKLLTPMNPSIAPAVWRRLFDPRWQLEGRPTGQVLLAGDEPVGFLGLLHARLPRPDGDGALLCNPTTWVVDAAYSARAVAMLMPVLRLKDTTVSNMTPSREAFAIFSRLGFVPLESHVTVLRPTPLARSAWGRPEEIDEAASILNHLPEWERTIARDHAGLARQLLLRERGGDHCYAIYTLGRRRGLRTARILYMTPGTLSSASVALRNSMLRRHLAVLTEFDSRLGSPDLPGSRQVARAFPRLYKPADLDAAEVPNVYSELVLLDGVN